MRRSLAEVTVAPTLALFEAMRVLNEFGGKTLVVSGSDGTLAGILTDGDIRRHIIAGNGLDDPVSAAMNREPLVVDELWGEEQARELFVERQIDCIPVVADDGRVVDALWWSDLFDTGRAYRRVDLPVVLMAGGKGTRLEPFTRILPKPLVPVGDRPVLQLIMDGFHEQGCDRFLVALNHKANLIRAFFAEETLPYSLVFFDEEEPLGTAGGLGLMRTSIDSTFVLANCDTIVDIEFADVVDYHRGHGNDITIIASMKHVVLPYGVCEVGADGELKSLSEKPRYDVLVSTGLYVMEPTVLDRITDGVRMDATDLIDAVRGDGRVGVYPVPERSWVDIGQLEELQVALDRMRVR